MPAEKEKYLVIVRGLSGSGKTTFADLICSDTDSRISIAADDYFYDENGTYRFEASDLKKAHAWCRQEVEICMDQGFEVIVVHNTFTRGWEVEPYLQIAAQQGYRLIVSSLFDSGLNDSLLSARSEHNVQIHNVRRQRQRWETDVFNPRPHRLV